jgi:hypothetical protein
MRLQRIVRLLSILVLCLLKPDLCRADPVSSLALDPAWLKLVHYEKTIFGNYRSQVTDPGFFLSPEGAHSPEEELRATVASFNQKNPSLVGNAKQIPHCAFPARLEWLRRKKVPLNLPSIPCTDQLNWRQGLEAKSATLVYSSAYPNNPASQFGHTLLRLNRANGEPILNYGANFEARLDSKDPAVIFALKGLLGFYRGEYTISRYYVKVNEYNFSESRDLWEYDLSLNPEEVDFLVSHLWELYASGGFSYYFLTHNCSYQLLTLIEAVRPDWNLTHGFRLYALPIDTMKRLRDQPGAIVSETLRPSLYSRMIDQIQKLTPEQVRQREAILNDEKTLPPETSVEVLESLVTTLDYKRRKESVGLSKTDQSLFNQVLVMRSKMGKVKNTPLSDSTSMESPLSTHDSSLLFGGTLHREGKWAGLIGARVALHDLVDPPEGYPRGFQVEVGKISASIAPGDSGRSTVRLEQLQLWDLLSLYPANSGDLQFSWALRTGGDRPLDFGKSDSFSFGLEAGTGVALAFSEKKRWIYGLLLAQGEWIQNSPKTGRYGPLGELGTNLSFSNALTFLGRVRLVSELNRPFERWGYWEADATIGWKLRSNIQLRAGGRLSGTEWFQKSQLPEWTSEFRWYY